MLAAYYIFNSVDYQRKAGYKLIKKNKTACG